MEWNGMEWNGRNGMEWNGMKGLSNGLDRGGRWCGMKNWNGVIQMEGMVEEEMEDG